MSRLHLWNGNVWTIIDFLGAYKGRQCEASLAMAAILLDVLTHCIVHHVQFCQGFWKHAVSVQRIHLQLSVGVHYVCVLCTSGARVVLVCMWCECLPLGTGCFCSVVPEMYCFCIEAFYLCWNITEKAVVACPMSMLVAVLFFMSSFFYPVLN